MTDNERCAVCGGWGEGMAEMYRTINMAQKTLDRHEARKP